MKYEKLIVVLMSIAVLGGCSSPGDTATAEDKKNLDNLIQHGVGTSGGAGAAPAKGDAKAAGTPGVVSGKVDPP